MRTWRARFLPAVSIMFLCASGVVWSSIPAQAVSCPGSTAPDDIEQVWTPSTSAAGFRAPIQLRTTGPVCASAGWDKSEVFVTGNSGADSTIGWIRDYGVGFCRFYHWSDGSGYSTGLVESRCGVDSGGTTRFYEVSKTQPDPGAPYYYTIFDCGTSDWSTCTDLSEGPAATDMNGGVDGVVQSEVNYGGTACTNSFMGSSTSTVLFGGSGHPIKGQETAAGDWFVESLIYPGPGVCNDYKSPQHNNDNFETYDTRN